MNAGHVCVVHAAMQTVVADFVVAPTNGRFSVNQKWHDVLPAAATVFRPAEWQIGAALPAPMPTSIGQGRATVRPRRSTARLEHLRGSALGFRNLTNYVARSLLETSGFRQPLHPHFG